MWLRRWQAYLLPGSAEHDQGFRRQIQRLAVTGLHVGGGVTIGATLFLTIGRFFIDPDPETFRLRVLEAGVVLGIGAINFALASWDWSARRAREASMTVSLFLAATLIFFSLYLSRVSPGDEDYIPSQVTLVLLVTVTASPLRPGQALLMGTLMCIIYVVETTLIQRTLYLGTGPVRTNMLFIMMLSLMCTGLAAVLYRQRYLFYRIYERSLSAAEELRNAESRAMLAEQAATLGRLSAALSHEMNTPIGALKSSVDTLLLLAARQAHATESEQPKLIRLQADLRRTIQESTRRLGDLVARMQRFSNLDKAEIQDSDLEELLRDAVALTRAEGSAHARFELDLQQMPRLTCRPAQINAVLHGVLGNAVQAIGDREGVVRISSRREGDSVEICIDNDGPGLTEEEISALFDPRFQVAGSRIASANWGMFSFRRMIRDHGGDISVQSPFQENGRVWGVRVRITLPLHFTYRS
jgi:signal transduction histidine kinase